MSGGYEINFLIFKLGIFLYVIGVFTRSAAVLPEDDIETYDFIVVGGGTAGCVLANRLSENGKHTVLLLESGGYPHPNMDIPALSPNYFTPEYIKTYATVPQRNVAGLTGGVVSFFTGQVLGGGSGINGMHFNRGHPLIYDHWANSTGDQSWSYANMLQYFKRVEDYKGRYPLTDQHGVGGPITVSRPDYAPGLEEWLSAGRELGYPNVDQNGPQQESFTAAEFSKRVGRRVSAYAGYIQPVIKERPNLKVIIHADVQRILFEADALGNARASGVSYTITDDRNETLTVTVQARKEVIVSAGAIGSPTLLLKSGVGPLSVLQDSGVPVIKDLPVGKNLHDHIYVLVFFTVSNTTNVFIPDRDLNENTWRVYNETGDGPYSSRNGDIAQAFLSSSQTSFAWPDLHVQLVATASERIVAPPGETSVFCIGVLTQPKSRGSITLNKTNIDEDPLVDFQYLEDPEDMIALMDGIKKILTIFEDTRPYQEKGARYAPSRLPACQELPFRSDEYWRCVIGQTGNAGYHAVGSCKMGEEDNPETVVDPELQVIGISGLRVVDASVMATVTNSNTMVAVYAIAEKASEMILRKWNSFM